MELDNIIKKHNCYIYKSIIFVNFVDELLKIINELQNYQLIINVVNFNIYVIIRGTPINFNLLINNSHKPTIDLTMYNNIYKIKVNSKNITILHNQLLPIVKKDTICQIIKYGESYEIDQNTKKLKISIPHNKIMDITNFLEYPNIENIKVMGKINVDLEELEKNTTLKVLKFNECTNNYWQICQIILRNRTN